MSLLSELGEGRLLGEFLQRLPGAGGDLLVGPGDDCAAYLAPGGTIELATTDAMVAGVHFEPAGADWAGVGYRLVAANVSDVAAMGGEPTWALATIGLPLDFEETAALALMSGMEEAASALGARLIGGDTTSSPTAFISLALLGTTGRRLPVTRAGGRAGDRLIVTGPLGGAAAFVLSRSEASVDARLAAAYYRPPGRVRAGGAALRLGASAMIDLSDGLGTDLRNLCRASGCGASVEARRIPLNKAIAGREGVDPLLLAVSGGEDYELLIAAPPGQADHILEGVSDTGAAPAIIGELTGGGPDDVVWQRDGRTEALPQGYQHFEPPARASESPASSGRR